MEINFSHRLALPDSTQGLMDVVYAYRPKGFPYDMFGALSMYCRTSGQKRCAVLCVCRTECSQHAADGWTNSGDAASSMFAGG